MAQLFRGNLADTEFIRHQQPLPETTDELCAGAIARGGSRVEANARGDLPVGNQQDGCALAAPAPNHIAP
jgi:hypothetical protein